MRDADFSQLQKIVPNVSRETFSDFCAYEALLRKWQPHINLVANATLPNLWQRHILDSVQLFPLQKTAIHWLDLGSGGGFPALVLAIMLKAQNRENTGSAFIDLVESNGKKAAFLQTVIAALSLPARVHNKRIESCYEDIAAPDVITARALADLSTLFTLIFPWCQKKTVALLQKGRDYERECEEAGAKWSFDLVTYNSAMNEESVILEIRHLHPVIKSERQMK